MIRGWGHAALVAGELIGIGALCWFGYWSRRGFAGKLLVLLWCMAPLAMTSAVAVFYLHKHVVLDAQGARAQELGRHFIVGYASFDDIAPLAARGSGDGPDL